MGFDSLALFESQVDRLSEAQFLLLFWSAKSESCSVKYNLTNFFDDLKFLGITRTKQTAISVIDSVASLCFIELRDERNRKNVYITHYGAKALAMLVESRRFETRDSSFLEGC
jgi:hypothetical protein